VLVPPGCKARESLLKVLAVEARQVPHTHLSLWWWWWWVWWWWWWWWKHKGWAAWSDQRL
jgi:hypothetical protein